MKKADYRKFIIRTVEGNDEFRIHEGSDRAQVRAAERGERGVSGIGVGRRRAGATACGSGGVEALGSRVLPWLRSPSARMDLRLRAGRRTHCAR